MHTTCLTLCATYYGHLLEFQNHNQFFMVFIIMVHCFAAFTEGLLTFLVLGYLFRTSGSGARGGQEFFYQLFHNKNLV